MAKLCISLYVYAPVEMRRILCGLCRSGQMCPGQFTHRVAATTCCSQTGLACLNPMNLRIDLKRAPEGRALEN
jgi:hypothetical protein